MLGHVDGGAKNKGGGSKTVHYRQRQQQKKSTHKQQQQQQQKLSHTQQQKQAKSTHHQPQPPPPPQQQQQQDTHRHQQTHQPHPARGPRAADLSRAALVCENWYAITDQRLPSIRTNVDGGIFLLGPSGIDYAPMGDHSAAGLASATSSLEGSHIMPSRLAFENKVADDNREHTVKQLLIDFEAGKIDEDEFEQQKYQLKVRQLTRLRQQLGKGLISPAAYNLEAARIIDEHKTGPFDAEVRINFFGTQRELSELVDKLKEVLASDRPRASEENQKNDAPNSAKCPPKAVVEIVKSRFAVRSGVGAALFARDNNGLDNPDDPELMRRREQELLEAAERKVAEKQAAELAKRRAQATKWLLSDLGAHSTVPGVELSEHNMSKCDRTVRAIVDEVQRDDESVVVTPALQTYLRKYAVLTEQMRVWHAQQAMEKDSMQESSRTVREQAKALAKDQERKIVQLMEEKDMLDKRLRLMEQQSRSSISDFALQTGNTQELKSRIQDLEHQVEDLENELRLSKAAFTELEESVQVSGSVIVIRTPCHQPARRTHTRIFSV